MIIYMLENKLRESGYIVMSGPQLQLRGGISIGGLIRALKRLGKFLKEYLWDFVSGVNEGRKEEM